MLNDVSVRLKFMCAVKGTNKALKIRKAGDFIICKSLFLIIFESLSLIICKRLCLII